MWRDNAKNEMDNRRIGFSKLCNRTASLFVYVTAERDEYIEANGLIERALHSVGNGNFLTGNYAPELKLCLIIIIIKNIRAIYLVLGWDPLRGVPG